MWVWVCGCVRGGEEEREVGEREAGGMEEGGRRRREREPDFQVFFFLQTRNDEKMGFGYLILSIVLLKIE